MEKQSQAAIMRRVQQLHLWLGTLFAPMIIFFALTGALQTFGLHEGSGSSALIATLAQIHKNQRLGGGRPPGPPPGFAPPSSAGAGDSGRGTNPQQGEPPAQRPEGARAPQGPSPLPLKIFVALMSVGLIVTTSLGIWMAFKYSKNKAIVWALLAAGIFLPIALLFV